MAKPSTSEASDRLGNPLPACPSVEDVERQVDRMRIVADAQMASALAVSRSGGWESLSAHGGGRRMTVEGLTVGAFHLFVAADEIDPRPDALVVYAVDIWPDGFPGSAD